MTGTGVVADARSCCIQCRKIGRLTEADPRGLTGGVCRRTRLSGLLKFRAGLTALRQLTVSVGEDALLGRSQRREEGSDGDEKDHVGG